MNQIIKFNEYAKQINQCHNNIENSFKHTLEYGIKAGGLLIEIKENLPHGEFLQWIKDNCFFSDKTAQTYMKCFEYKSEIETLSNLNEAYQKVKLLENEKKYEYKKISDEQYKANKEKIFNKPIEIKIKKDEYDKLKQENETLKSKDKQHDVFFENIINKSFESLKNKNEFTDKLKTIFKEQESFFEVINEYLNKLDNNTLKLEALHNIIKFCKNKAIELHQLSIKAN
jgi:hypothetical protein